MGLFDFLKSGARCSVCHEKNTLHRRDPPVCERCYWKWYIDQVHGNTGLVKEKINKKQ